MEYFETYYYVNVIHNILSDPFEWLPNLHQWHENNPERLFSPPFNKWSKLHDFAAHVIDGLMYEAINDVTEDALVHDPTYELWIDEALRHHGFPTDGIRQWLSDSNVELQNLTEDHIYDYYELNLSWHRSELVKHLAGEVFYVVFGNRALLAKFNSYVANVVSNLAIEELDEEAANQFERPGKLKRVHIPRWAEDAVFFRDRGKCANCHADLSRLLSIGFSKHIDHIVPLAKGGINDITNLQLLCGECNLSKGAKQAPVSSHYEAWYE